MSKIEIYRDSLDYRVEGRPHNMVRATRTTKDGVEYIGVSVFPVNLSEKKIKYLTFTFVPYNNVGDPVTDEVTGKTEWIKKFTGHIEPVTQNIFSYWFRIINDKGLNEGIDFGDFNIPDIDGEFDIKFYQRIPKIGKIEFDDLWTDESITDVLIKKVIVQYVDNSEETIQGEEIKDVLSEDSEYDKKYGKHEEEDFNRVAEERKKEIIKKQEEEKKRQEEREREFEKEEKKEKMKIIIGCAIYLIPIIVIIILAGWVSSCVG